MQLHRKVERGLATQGGQEGRRAFFGDDFFENLDRQRFDVGDIGKLRISHDRGRIRVHKNDLIPLLPQRFAGLRTRVIKLAGLADDDWAGSDDEDGL